MRDNESDSGSGWPWPEPGGQTRPGGRDTSGGWSGPPPQRQQRRGHFLVYLAVAVLAAALGAGLTAAFAGGHGPSPSAGISSRDIPSPDSNAAGSGTSPSLNQAAVERKVKPGLVDITSTLKYDSETAEGTGMILSASGLVLTNNHVINGATSVKASLADNPGRVYPARVIGYDSADDIALLQLTGASGLPTVSFGNSGQVIIGTPVLALGDAEGRGGVTPAAGDISALNRSIQASDQGSGTTEDLNHMLQTDARIQQGDSGGALANDAGQVIGMVTAADTPPPGQPGVTTGFAIPINSALAVARQIAADQASSTVHIGLPGFLGVEVAQSNSPNPRQQARDELRADDGGTGQGGTGQGGTGQGGIGQGTIGQGGSACVAAGQGPRVPPRIAPAVAGALIFGVLCGTGAQSERLAPGDVIISVDGQAVSTPGSLSTITARYHPGTVVSVGWISTNGSRHTTPITLGEGPAR